MSVGARLLQQVLLSLVGWRSRPLAQAAALGITGPLPAPGGLPCPQPNCCTLVLWPDVLFTEPPLSLGPFQGVRVVAWGRREWGFGRVASGRVWVQQRGHVSELWRLRRRIVARPSFLVQGFACNFFRNFVIYILTSATTFVTATAWKRRDVSPGVSVRVSLVFVNEFPRRQ